MRRIIDTTELLGEIDTALGPCDLCASAVAHYDEEQRRLVIDLEASLRTANIRAKEKRVPGEWLPKPEHIVESAALEEARDIARDVFHRWVGKVRKAVPALKTTAV